MESLETAAWLVDDLLDFSSDIGEEDEGGDEKNNSSHKTNKVFSKPLTSKEEEEAVPTIFNPDKENPFPVFQEVFQEEELEWISNQDAFPSIETCDILIEKPIGLPNHQSPVSILLDSSSISSSSSSISSSNGGIMSCCGTPRVPARARSKRRRRSPSSFSDFAGQKWCFWSEPMKRSGGRISKTTLGRKCTHCLSEKTPQWRAGPSGPKTLCNACGVRFKSGRLMPEYRPASSPTFLSQMHSNSHKKILEMRRQKQKTVLQSLDKGENGVRISMGEVNMTHDSCSKVKD